MEFFRNSASYIWDTSNKLGKGLTGSVYKGMHKISGESVAVKVYINDNNIPIDHLQEQEFSILKSLHHENIVRLLAMEVEVETGNKVLVTELCNGQSLHSVLSEPENYYGLSEEEFVRVLHDLSAGMEYLRANNKIHRDLKPGNIVKFITVDGRYIYKLIDFGMSRNLKDDELFRTACGTPGFLHPDLFARLKLNDRSKTSFPATVDLWSIGVTIYNFATGSLPFCTYGNNSNDKTMMNIIANKPSGSISGIEASDGSIEYSKELPTACLLSPMLRKLVEELLSGILESDGSKLWSFDDFFKFVAHIMSYEIIHVFYVNEGIEINLYMKPDATCNDVKKEIDTQFKVPPKNQILSFHKVDFNNEMVLDVKAFPKTSSLQPMILFHSSKGLNNQKYIQDFQSLAIHFPKFPAPVYFLDDSFVGKKYCAVAYIIKQYLQKLIQCRELLLSTIQDILDIISVDSSNLDSSSRVSKQRIEGNWDTFEKRSRMIATFLESWTDKSQFEKEQQEVAQLVDEMQPLKLEVNRAFSEECQWKEREQVLEVLQTARNDSPELAKCIKKIETYISEMRESWDVLVQDHTLYKEQKSYVKIFHDLSRLKIDQAKEKLVDVEKECRHICSETFERLNNAFGSSGFEMNAIMAISRSQTELRESQISKMKEFSNTFEQAESKLDATCQKIGSVLKQNKNVNPLILNGETTEFVTSNSNTGVSLILRELIASHAEVRHLASKGDSLFEELQHVSSIFDSGFPQQ